MRRYRFEVTQPLDRLQNLYPICQSLEVARCSKHTKTLDLPLIPVDHRDLGGNPWFGRVAVVSTCVLSQVDSACWILDYCCGIRTFRLTEILPPSSRRRVRDSHPARAVARCG